MLFTMRMVLAVLSLVTATEESTVWERTLPPGLGRQREVLAASLTDTARCDVLILAGERGRPMLLLALDGRGGSELWRRRVHPVSWAVPAALQRGRPLSVAVASGDTLLLLDGATGDTRGAVELPGVVGEIVTGDLDGDGRDEIVCTSGTLLDDMLTCWETEPLALRWSRSCAAPAGGRDDGFALPSVSTGLGRVLVREHRNTLLCFSSGGDVVWKATLGEKSGLVPTGTAVTQAVALDVDGAGALDVVVGRLDGTLLVLDGDSGDVLRSRVFGGAGHRALAARRRLPKAVERLLIESGEPATGYVAARVDGFPGDELVFPTTDGVVHAYSPRRDTLLWTTPVRGSVEYGPMLAVAGDRACVVVPTTERVYYLEAREGVELSAVGPTCGCSRLLLGTFSATSRLEALTLHSSSAAVRLHRTALSRGRP
jgi:hypothetical protein